MTPNTTQKSMYPPAIKAACVACVATTMATKRMTSCCPMAHKAPVSVHSDRHGALPATGVECGDESPLSSAIKPKPRDTAEGDACGLMAAAAGPFSACHDRVNPKQHVINCVFDMCVMDGDRAMLCENIQAYAIICQQAKIQIMPWRNSHSAVS